MIVLPPFFCGTTSFFEVIFFSFLGNPAVGNHIPIRGMAGHRDHSEAKAKAKVTIRILGVQKEKEKVAKADRDQAVSGKAKEVEESGDIPI